MIINLLFHKYPIVCKNTADTFYMYVMTQGEEEFEIDEDTNDELQDILLDQDWLEMSEKEKAAAKQSIEAILGDRLPAQKTKAKKEEEKVEENTTKENDKSGDDEI